MMDALVQFIRNALCCVKDLGWFRTTELWDATIPSRYYDFPAPLNKTTPLEVIISVTQLYACLSNARNGIRLALRNSAKFQRIERLLMLREPVRSDADRIVNASLVKEGMAAIRGLVVGMLVFFIGISFFWLFANSWHITETTWIGGVEGLVHALSVMEACLLPLLFLMYRDGIDYGKQAVHCRRVAEQLSGAGGEGTTTPILTPATIDLTTIEMTDEWNPFWADDDIDLTSSDDQTKLVAKEVSQVKTIFQKLFGKEEDSQTDKAKKKGDTDAQAKTNNSSSTVSKEYQKTLADNLLMKGQWKWLESYREFLYLALNSIAFYGYLVGIMVYYWDVEEKQPFLLRHYLLGNRTNADADWYGNFAGDLMWTVEPLVILSSPGLFRFLTAPQSPRTSAQKEKAD